MRFPDYGLSYKYGGWHLTHERLHRAGRRQDARLRLLAGSSCNYRQEREVLRAVVISIDPDGKHPSVVAQGMRNAVDLRWISELDGGALYATNMGDDHLGDKLPEDTFFQSRHLNTNGCQLRLAYLHYFANGKAVLDQYATLPSMNDPALLRAVAGATDEERSRLDLRWQAGRCRRRRDEHGCWRRPRTNGWPHTALGKPPTPLKSCEDVAAAYTTFAAHSSPLGFESTLRRPIHP